MRFFYSVILLLLMMPGCSDDDPAPWENNCPDGECSFKIYPDSRLSVFEAPNGVLQASIQPGDKIVFEYRFTLNDNPGIADDEFSEVLYFETDAGSDEINLSGEEQFINTLTLYQHTCFCVYTGYLFPDNGNITGQKVSEDSWDISIDVSIESEFVNRSIQTRGIFRP